MQIEKDKVFSFFYSLKNEVGEELENNRDGEPQAVMYGRRQILSGLESAVIGKAAGDKLNVTLTPERAYGFRNEEAKARVPIKHLVNKPVKIKPGMVVQVNTKQGVRNASVIKVGKFNVDLDTNHPFAGKTLTFDLEIVDVRDATGEELAHGHAHGVGGHGH